MSRTTRKHVRVFYVDLMRDYPEVYFDPTALSTWLRLLVTSDQAWPSDPILPAAVRRADVDRLQGCGLIALGPNRQYAIKGYRAERQARADAGRKGALVRHSQSARTPNALLGEEDQRIRGSEDGLTRALTSTTRGRRGLVEPTPA